MKKTVIEEYNDAGKLIKRTIIEEPYITDTAGTAGLSQLDSFRYRTNTGINPNTPVTCTAVTGTPVPAAKLYN